MERRIQDSSTGTLVKHVAGGSIRRTDTDNDEQRSAPVKEQDPGRFTKKAMDEISLCSDEQLKHDQENRRGRALVEHIKFTDLENRINLPKLVLLACAINQQSTTYHITKRNCYWFCYAVAEVLKKAYRHHLVPIGGRNLQGRWAGFKFCDEVNIDDLLAATDKLWTEFVKQIEDIVDNPRNRHIAEANQRAEEEARLRGEAERRAEEETRRAEEAERRIAELEAQLAQAAQTRATQP